MSEKKTKQSRKMKIMTEEANARKVAEEQAKAICKMYEDRDAKALAAKDHLVSQLEVTVDKYRTANGVMSALQTVRMVVGDNDECTVIEQISIAKAMATAMAKATQEMANKAYDLDPESMDKLCDGFYDENFSENEGSINDMVFELMVLQLCQNVGPDAGDIVDFLKNADQEIEKAKENLEAYCDENKIDFDELCGPHGDCHDCLCELCEKDCKDHKIIKEGQSAYEVCRDFVEKE